MSNDIVFAEQGGIIPRQQLIQIFGRRGSTSIGPSTTYNGDNAFIEIHDDCPQQIKRNYKNSITRLRFQFLDSNVTESIAPRYENIDVTGRSESYMSYAGAESRQISLELMFAASAEQADSGSIEVVTRCTRWLQSLTLPTYVGTVSYGAALCRLVLGRFINARGVVTGCDVTYRDGFTGVAGMEHPIMASVSLQFTCVNRRPQQASDFMPNQFGDVRGL